MTTTSIEWTDKTWNPVTGCTKVSPGCAHCYAEGVADRFWGKQYPPMRRENPERPGHFQIKPRGFTDVMTHADRLDQPLRWKKPARIFVNSMSDLFHEDVPESFIGKVFDVMAQARRHTFQVLTKRADRMHSLVPTLAAQHTAKNGSGWPLPNVWLGVSVENQHFADERIPLLLQTPAAVRFISAEPLLGPVDLGRLPNPGLAEGQDWLDALKGYAWVVHGPDYYDVCSISGKLDWVIVGGESGPQARPFDIQWARMIIEECRVSGVPVFVKQLGSNPDNSAQPDGGLIGAYITKKGGDPSEWPEDLRVREFPA